MDKNKLKMLASWGMILFTIAFFSCCIVKALSFYLAILILVIATFTIIIGFSYSVFYLLDYYKK